MAHDPKRIVVIGIGGIGSWFVPGLVRALEFGAPGSQIVLVDGDSYEAKNAQRQQFSTLGNKAQVMRKDLAHHFPETIIVAFSAWVVPQEQTKKSSEEEGISKIGPLDLVNEGDHVFVIVDNYATRTLLFDAAREYQNIDIYTGGNGEDLTGSIYHYVRRNSEDVTAHPGFFHDEFVNPPDKNPGSLSCEERAKIDGGTQVLAANMGVASLLLSKVSYYILGTKEQNEASVSLTEIHFDMEVGLSQPYDFSVEVKEKENAAVAIPN